MILKTLLLLLAINRIHRKALNLRLTLQKDYKNYLVMKENLLINLRHISTRNLLIKDQAWYLRQAKDLEDNLKINQLIMIASLQYKMMNIIQKINQLINHVLAFLHEQEVLKSVSQKRMLRHPPSKMELFLLQRVVISRHRTQIY